MTMVIKQFETTEWIRQIFFLQLFNRINESQEFCYLQVDLTAIEVQFPGFLESRNFTGISVNELFKYITFELRMGRESIYQMDFDYTHFPEYLYAFCDTYISANYTDFNEFPALYDRVEESTENNLVALYIFHSVYIYNGQGEFLNFSRHPNLYDDGCLGVTFLNNMYLTVDFYDENNRSHIELLKYENGQLIPATCSSEELLELMENRGCQWGFDNLSEDLRDDKDVVLSAFKNIHSTNLFRYDLAMVSTRLRDDDEVAEAAVCRYSDNYQLLSDRLKCKEGLAMRFIKSWPQYFQRLPDVLKSDKNFVLTAVASKPEVIDYLKEPFQTDPEIVSLAIQSYPEACAYFLSLAPPEFLRVKANVKEIVAKYPKALLQLSNDFITDEEVLKIAIKKDASVAELMTSFQTDRDLALKMVGVNGAVIKYLNTFNEDIQFALKCVELNGLYLQYFSDFIRNNKQIVLQAYRQNNRAIYFAADGIRKDDEIAELLDREKVDKIEKNELPF
jgi:hypothetical protein